MDIDTTMKINALAKDLQNKGIAESSEEAAKMAEQMLRKGTLPKTKGPSLPQTDKEKVEIYVERIARKYNREIDELKEHVKRLTAVSDELRQEIMRLKRQVIEAKPKQEMQATLSKKEVQPQFQAKPEPAKKDQEYSPNDVAVDKIFYCGNR